MRQKQKVLVLEFAIQIGMLVTLLQDLLTIPDPISLSNQLLYGLGFVSLVTVKVLMEGTRLTLFAQTITNAFLMISKSKDHQNYYLLSVVVLTLLLTFLLMVKLPVYQYPNPTGIYGVGFREFQLGGDYVSVYYPVDRSKENLRYKHQLKQVRKRIYADELHEHFKPAFKYPPPRWFARVMLGFLQKSSIPVYLKAPLTEDIEEFKTIIFSNGLGGIRDHYSILLREYASQGYIVYARQYDEQFNVITREEYADIINKGITLKSDEGRKFIMGISHKRNAQLRIRVAKTKELLDHITKSEFVESVFSQVVKTTNDIIGAGHSFGGCTVFQTAIEDKRINGGVLLYDPYFLPLAQDDLSVDLKIPILCINSETFQHREYNLTIERSLLIFKAQSKYLCVEIINSDHLSFCDIPHLIPGEQNLFSEKMKLEHIETVTTAMKQLSNIFLDNRKSNLKGVYDLFVKHKGQAIVNKQYVN